MKCVVAGYGSRGDVEPCIAIARELARRGHEIQTYDELCFPELAAEWAEKAGRRPFVGR
jgi:UDP:flavonoid glycosyltransferase YjiC (YdhE family)